MKQKYSKKHKDELGLNIPKNYFETSKAHILNQIKEENTSKETRVFNLKRISLYTAVAASLMIFIGFMFFKKNTHEVVPKTILVKSDFEFSDNDTPLNMLFINNENIDNYIDVLLEDITLADIENNDNVIENNILELLFENDSLIDKQLDNLVFNTMI